MRPIMGRVFSNFAEPWDQLSLGYLVLSNFCNCHFFVCLDAWLRHAWLKRFIIGPTGKASRFKGSGTDAGKEWLQQRGGVHSNQGEKGKEGNKFPRYKWCPPRAPLVAWEQPANFSAVVAALRVWLLYGRDEWRLCMIWLRAFCTCKRGRDAGGGERPSVVSVDTGQQPCHIATRVVCISSLDVVVRLSGSHGTWRSARRTAGPRRPGGGGGDHEVCWSQSPRRHPATVTHRTRLLAGRHCKGRIPTPTPTSYWGS